MSILNGISGSLTSDPNSQSAQSQKSVEQDLNRFLTLLTTQLQHQDPLNPMDSTQFTSQLVQFASVEQQIYQNSNLEKLVKLQETNKLSSLTNFINTRVEVESSDAVLENGKADFTYNTPSGATSTKISIINDAGETVFNADGDSTSGVHTVSWDGTSNNGDQNPDGKYHIQVTCQDNNGNLLDVYQTSFGRVTGAGVVDGTTTLFLGPLRVPEDSVLSVEETSTGTDTSGSGTDTSGSGTDTSGSGTDTTNTDTTTTTS